MTGTRSVLSTGVAAFTAVVLLIVLAGPAGAAGPPLSGSGEGVITSVQTTSSREAGGNRIEERRLEGVMTGTLEGTFVEEVRGVVHANGQVTFQGTLVFTGTVADCGDGTITGRLQGRGEAGPSPVTDATIRVVDQASNTVAISGQGSVHQHGPFLAYEIQYHCR